MLKTVFLSEFTADRKMSLDTTSSLSSDEDSGGVWYVTLLGLSMGFLHIITGPDHLSALSTLAVGKSAASAFGLGVRWGSGHSFGLLLVAIVFFAMGDTLDLNGIAFWADLIVGVFMVCLGVFYVIRAYSTLHRTNNLMRVSQDYNNNHTNHQSSSSLVMISESNSNNSMWTWVYYPPNIIKEWWFKLAHLFQERMDDHSDDINGGIIHNSDHNNKSMTENHGSLIGFGTHDNRDDDGCSDQLMMQPSVEMHGICHNVAKYQNLRGNDNGMITDEWSINEEDQRSEQEYQLSEKVKFMESLSDDNNEEEENEQSLNKDDTKSKKKKSQKMNNNNNNKKRKRKKNEKNETEEERVDLQTLDMDEDEFGKNDSQEFLLGNDTSKGDNPTKRINSEYHHYKGGSSPKRINHVMDRNHVPTPPETPMFYSSKRLSDSKEFEPESSETTSLTPNRVRKYGDSSRNGSNPNSRIVRLHNPHRSSHNSQSSSDDSELNLGLHSNEADTAAHRCYTRLAAFGAGVIAGIAGPGGVLGVMVSVRMNYWLFSGLYLSMFFVSSILTMGLYAVIYGKLTRVLSEHSEDSHKCDFSLKLFSAGLSIVVGILWLILVFTDTMDKIFPG